MNESRAMFCQIQIFGTVSFTAFMGRHLFFVYLQNLSRRRRKIDRGQCMEFAIDADYYAYIFNNLANTTRS